MAPLADRRRRLTRALLSPSTHSSPTCTSPSPPSPLPPSPTPPPPLLLPPPRPPQAQFTHQIWIRAATYAYLAALFLPADSLQPLLHTAAARYTAAALAGQAPSPSRGGGVWTERGAFDAHYQGVSTLYAARAAAAAPTASARQRVLDALAAGLPPLLRAIGPDGRMSVAGSARVAHERSRDGRPKTLDVKGTATALLYARALLGDGPAAAAADTTGGTAVTAGTVGWPPPPGVGVRPALAPAAMVAAARKYGPAHTARFRAALRTAMRRGPEWRACERGG